MKNSKTPVRAFLKTLFFAGYADFVVKISVPAVGAYLVPLFGRSVKAYFFKLHAIHESGIAYKAEARGKLY